MVSCIEDLCRIGNIGVEERDIRRTQNLRGKQFENGWSRLELFDT